MLNPFGIMASVGSISLLVLAVWIVTVAVDAERDRRAFVRLAEFRAGPGMTTTGLGDAIDDVLATQAVADPTPSVDVRRHRRHHSGRHRTQ